MGRIAKMTVWNVQLGLAIHIKAPNGKYIVIDLGTGTEESGNISPLKQLKFEDIAFMILTHPHLDHIDDILNFDINRPKVLLRQDHLSNEDVMRNVRECDKPKFVKYCEINNQYNIPISPYDAYFTENPNNYGGLEIKKFHTEECNNSNFNNFSIITVLTLSNVKVVICGDNEKESFDILMNQEKFKSAVKDADVLVAPHHGRESAYHAEFVSLVNPRITIISDTIKDDSSASGKYTEISRGWDINGIKRYCLTTRNDGNIIVEFGESDDPDYYGILDINLTK